MRAVLSEGSHVFTRLVLRILVAACTIVLDVRAQMAEAFAAGKSIVDENGEFLPDFEHRNRR